MKKCTVIKLLCLLLSVFILFSLCACGAQNAESDEARESATAAPEPEIAEPEVPVPEEEPVPEPAVYSDGRDRPSSAGQLRVLDGKLCGEDGTPVMLRGVSSYGLSVGGAFVNEQLFRELSGDAGVNVFRLALYTQGVGVVGYCTGGDKDSLKQCVEDGVEFARLQDMYAIIDWHVLGEGDPNI